MRTAMKTLVFLCWIGLVPSAALAQGVIAGTVKDSSGAVLPGVTVEAASPALIEKVRTGVSDGTGQYRIEDLRPGLYMVTFTLHAIASSPTHLITLAVGDLDGDGKPDLVGGGMHINRPYDRMGRVTMWKNNR